MSVGSLETEISEIDTRFGDKKFKLRYGILPQLLQVTLMLSGTSGIIGFGFFNNFRVLLNLKNNSLKYAYN